MTCALLRHQQSLQRILALHSCSTVCMQPCACSHHQRLALRTSSAGAAHLPQGHWLHRSSASLQAATAKLWTCHASAMVPASRCVHASAAPHRQDRPAGHKGRTRSLLGAAKPRQKVGLSDDFTYAILQAAGPQNLDWTAHQRDWLANLLNAAYEDAVVRLSIVHQCCKC